MQQFLIYANHHPLLLGATIAVAVALAVNEFLARRANFSAVSPAEAVALVNSGALIVDIRTREAFEAGHIPHARNVPGSTIAEGAQVLDRFKEKAIIAYCDTGATAGAAARHLARLGFTRAHNLRGGLAAWRQDNLPIEKG
jgi:rhodanese-related sulfurtransferase